MFTLRRLIRCQRGSSYSLPFVMVVPFYLVFVLTVFEITFLLLAKMGTQYAAHAVARSAVVWQSAGTIAEAELVWKRAAWSAMTPFGGGRQRELDSAGPIPEEARACVRAYVQANRRYLEGTGAGHVPPDDFVERKFLISAARTDVEVEALEPDNPHGLLRATVKYRAPLYMPVVSRFLDADGQAPFEYPLSASVTFPNDAPVSKKRTLGIDYNSNRFAE